MFYSGDSGENPISFVEIDIRARKEKRNLFFIIFSRDIVGQSQRRQRRRKGEKAITERTGKKEKGNRGEGNYMEYVNLWNCKIK